MKKTISELLILSISVTIICVTLGILSVLGTSDRVTFAVGLILTYLFTISANLKGNISMIDDFSDRALGRGAYKKD